MGVLYDYFRAADAASVMRALERTDGNSPVVGDEPAVFDGVEAKGVDPAVVLGKLVAAINRVPWRVDLVQDTTVWPTGPAPDPNSDHDEDDPWMTGPWVSELDPGTRDALAGVRDADVSAVVVEWARADELRGASVEDLRPLVEELVELARRAIERGERLYCWMCL